MKAQFERQLRCKDGAVRICKAWQNKLAENPLEQGGGQSMVGVHGLVHGPTPLLVSEVFLASFTDTHCTIPISALVFMGNMFTNLISVLFME